MKVSELNSITPLKSLTSLDNGVQEASNNNAPSFVDYLKNALGEVDGLEKQASIDAEKLALGDQSYLHDTIIAYEKASLALELTVEVRNKIVEAYQEIMRMQM
ncbi:MAG: flagellar hook-basal body complex protein FliE [Syntrophomonas sp.]